MSEVGLMGRVAAQCYRLVLIRIVNLVTIAVDFEYAMMQLVIISP